MTRHRQCLVLLVEDHPETYELYSEILASAGYSVAGSGSGREAYRLAASLHPDLIIMDDELSDVGTDGYDAAELIRNDPATRAIPILMIAGRTTPEQLDHARRLGCNSLLHKPCAVDELLAEARRLIPEDSAPILVVEDDESIRAALAEVLRDEGFVVQTACNGREAIELLRGAKEKPKLVLLDLMMPVMDGWEFRTAQLADPELAKIPVVILSAAHDVRKHAQALHVDEYLPKPLNVPKLLDAIERHV
jgi:CheY-like chemotaxis protein